MTRVLVRDPRTGREATTRLRPDEDWIDAAPRAYRTLTGRRGVHVALSNRVGSACWQAQFGRWCASANATSLDPTVTVYVLEGDR